MKKILLTALLVPVIAFAQTYPSPTFNSVTLQNPLAAAYGGTGVANSNTISLGGNLVTSGASPLTLTTTGATNITLPTSGTLLNGTSGATAGANSNITSLSGVTTPLSVPQGGTGVATSTGTGAVVLGTSPTISTPAITGGSINNATVGQSTPLAGSFTTLSATSLTGLTTPLAAAYGGAGAATPQQYGALGNGTNDDTSAINAMFAASNHGYVYFPCGTYSVSQITLPGTAGNHPTDTKVWGAGACAQIVQNSSNLANNLFTIGSGNLNDTGDVWVSDLFITAASAKTGGSGIYLKGAARPQFKNVLMSNMYNGMSMDGVDFAHFDHVVIFGPTGNDGIQLWDGFDCGFTPVQLTTNAATSTSSNVIHLASTTGLVVGMNIFSKAPNNTPSIGTIASIQTNTSATLSANAVLAVASGQTLVFGGDCAGTTATFTGDTTITGATNNAIGIYGGVGGVYIDSAHLYSSLHGLVTSAANSQGITNREIFLFPGTDIDSNSSTGLYVQNNSITKLISTGAWINASASNGAVFIGSQLAGNNPVESGATVSFTGGVAGQSGGSGISWADSGTLTISGVDISYNYPASGTIGSVSGDGINITSGTGVGQVVINGTKLRSNGRYGVALSGSYPADTILTNSIMTNNATGTTNMTASSTMICTGNLGGSGGC